MDKSTKTTAVILKTMKSPNKGSSFVSFVIFTILIMERKVNDMLFSIVIAVFLPSARLIAGGLTYAIYKWMDKAYKEAKADGAVYKGHLSELNN